MHFYSIFKGGKRGWRVSFHVSTTICSATCEATRIYKFISNNQACNQDFFSAGEFSWSFLGNFDEHSPTARERKAPQENSRLCFRLKNCILYEKFYP